MSCLIPKLGGQGGVVPPTQSVALVAQHPTQLTSLVMLNPLLNYRKRLIDDKSYWHDGQISEEAV